MGGAQLVVTVSSDPVVGYLVLRNGGYQAPERPTQRFLRALGSFDSNVEQQNFLFPLSLPRPLLLRHPRLVLAHLAEQEALFVSYLRHRRTPVTIHINFGFRETRVRR